MKYAHITGWGAYVPPKVVTNDDLSKIMDTSDAWIHKMTGIRARRYAEQDSCADMGAKAALDALDLAGVRPAKVDLIIVCTSTPDRVFPATACDVQAMIGATNAAAFDLSVACAGFVYGLGVASDMIKAGGKSCVLVIGAERMSKLMDMSDRNTAVLFGDGAGAVLVQASNQPGGVLAHVLHADGTGADHLLVDDRQKMIMNGREVFKFATRAMPAACKEVIAKAGWRIRNVDYFVPHQANVRIIEAAAKQFGLELDRFFINIEKYGNTSSASIPIALTEAASQGRLRQNSKIVLVGFGGGLAWGACALTWDVPKPATGAGRFLNRLGYRTHTARSNTRRRFRELLGRLRGKRANEDELIA